MSSHPITSQSIQEEFEIMASAKINEISRGKEIETGRVEVRRIRRWIGSKLQPEFFRLVFVPFDPSGDPETPVEVSTFSSYTDAVVAMAVDVENSSDND